MKWNVCRKLSFLLSLCSPLYAEPLTVPVHAEAALLMNAKSGAILYEKNPHQLHYPASTTKVVTALYALKQLGNDLDTLIIADQDSIASITEEAKKRSNYTLPAHWLIPGSSHMGIKKGEALPLRSLFYGLLLVSAGDAANLIAKHVAGTVPQFMDGMNSYCKEIGCRHTLFYNPHGTHHPKHRSTAYDMALIMREAIKSPAFCEFVSATSYQRPKTNKQAADTLFQSNKLMQKGKYYYPKALGGKTGYYALAGHCFVVAARQEDRTLVAVLLKAPERVHNFEDAIALFEAAFNQKKMRKVLLKAGPQQYTHEISGASTPLSTYTKEDIAMEYYPAEEPKVKCFLYWKSHSPAIEKGDVVGELHLQTEEGQLLQKVSLFAREKVSATWAWRLQNLL
jgi:D-alanyl-D-alanine carboxypeptidase (penicillin-binding protein 5/6)